MPTDQVIREASLRRKADAIEKAHGDPVKVAELRAQLPAERTATPAVAVTAAPEVPAEVKTTEPKPAKLAATRGIAKAE